ncbi:MAG: zinc metalloprotease HtpX [Candidatus Taylorbacteria bacterium CG11_big_fil_rev_8_21_14_0_20_46_11]|uniref:Protease HtpX homolog n=1 Tax=Candidatus Taylorbacteria bacterium CG11_big_fil_rev_8_21_14_0_20_46_11 TaxID=1975025 RepID=A0A2H0K9T2_9BACT|nr:MAG: zinc metalloprotease HtpX [Candidatus Taylorbacteria bacterium CG11_big_fil_rev_8_21_14_0_20_46_11]
MASLYTHQSENIRKTWLLMVVFLAVVIALGWFLSYYYGNPAILYFAIIFSLVMNVGSYWWSDKIVLKLTGARPASREEFFDLYTVTENLSITAGLPMPRLYVIHDSAPNAFATGRDEKHAVVCATTGLLQLLDRSELEGVIAHELSHIGNRDMLVSTVAVVLVGLVTLLADMFMRSLWFGGGNRDRGEGRLGAILMIVGVVLTLLSPIIATLIQLAISRKREFLADASGALLTRYPDGLANALQKISQYSRPMQKANHATAHLFIANPFGGGKVKGAMNKMFSTHPPVEERVKALMNKR